MNSGRFVPGIPNSLHIVYSRVLFSIMVYTKPVFRMYPYIFIFCIIMYREPTTINGLS